MSKKLNEKESRAVLDGVTRIQRVNWDVIGDDLNPEEVQVILDTDQGEMVYKCPHPWKMKNRDEFMQGAACGLLLSRVLLMLGLPLELFGLPANSRRNNKRCSIWQKWENWIFPG